LKLGKLLGCQCVALEARYKTARRTPSLSKSKTPTGANKNNDNENDSNNNRSSDHHRPVAIQYW
jgi:hypothetical protein